MKRFYKIAVATAISVFCFIGKPVEVNAQVVTTDPLSLVQQILQIFQDADMSGWLEGTSTLTSSIEQYDNLREKIEDVKLVLEFINDGKKLVSEVVSTSDLMLETYQYIDAFKDFYQTDDSSYSYVYLNNCEHIYDGFKQVALGLQDDFDNLLNQLTKFKRGESMNLMQAAGDLAEKFHSNVTALSYVAKTRCCKTYAMSSTQEESDMARKYLKTFIY